MKTQDYVKEFKLDQPNYQFNREKFMEAFGQEFKDRIEAMITACQKMKVQFTYEKFTHAIKEQQAKFNGISNKKRGEVLSEKLFSAFFALHVIPLRAKLFPDIHAQLEEKRKKAIEMAAQIEAEEKAREEKEKEMKPLLDSLIAYTCMKNLAKEKFQKK